LKARRHKGLGDPILSYAVKLAISPAEGIPRQSESLLPDGVNLCEHSTTS